MKKIVTKKLYVPTMHHADKCARETLKELVTWIGLEQLRKPEERVVQCGKSLFNKKKNQNKKKKEPEERVAHSDVSFH